MKTEQPTSYKLRFLQFIQIVMLLAVYGSSYLAVGVLSISTPLMVRTPNFNYSQVSLAIIFSKVFRFIPKLFSGTIVDIFGGKLMAISSHLSVSIVMCLIFITPRSNNFQWFLVLFIVQNIFTTVSWPSVVKISSQLFHYKSIGKVMSVISLSFLVGDAFSRLYLTFFIFIGFNWQYLFLITGVTMGIFGICGQLLIKNSPTDVGFEEPEANPDNLLGEHGNDSQIVLDSENFKKTFLPIFISPSFWLLALTYTILTFMRYLILDWIPAFLVAYANSRDDIASLGSVLPPLLGGASTLLMGYFNDKFPKNLRNFTMIIFEIFLSICCGILFFISFLKESRDVYMFSQMIDTIIYFAIFSLIGFFECSTILKLTFLFILINQTRY